MMESNLDSRVSKGMSKDRAKRLAPNLRSFYTMVANNLIVAVDKMRKSINDRQLDPMVILRVESRGTRTHVEVIPGLWCPKGDQHYALCRLSHIEKASKKLLRRLSQTEQEGNEWGSIL